MSSMIGTSNIHVSSSYEILYLVFFIVLGATCITGLVVQTVFMTFLKRRHTQVWDDLGRPNGFAGSPRQCWNLLRLLFSGRYVALKDRGVTALGTFLR